MNKSAVQVHTLAAAIALFSSPAAYSEDPPLLSQTCHQPPASSQALTPPPNNQTTISADDSSTKGNIYTLEGNVSIHEQDRMLKADRIIFDRTTGDISLDGHIQVQDPDMTISAKKGTANSQTKTGHFSDIEYQFNKQPGRGQADSITLQGTDKAQLKKITYTTCSRQKQDWVLKAREIKLNQKKETAHARDMSLWFKGIPIMYFPRFSFATGDQRKTGFLTPSLAQSSNTGSEINIPWYWNMAPERDMTLNLRHMSDRGTQLSTEYRHLFKQGYGTIVGEYLDDSRSDDSRYLLSGQYNGKLPASWTVSADMNYVSDGQYFDDLGQNLNTASITHLPRRLDLRHESRFGYIQLRGHEYQAIQTSNTWQRLPQISANLARNALDNHLQYGMQAEYTLFDHRDNATTGSRFDITPQLSLDWTKPAYYIRPTAAYRYTTYDVETAGISNSPSRNIPIFSLDSGLFFDRPLALAKKNFTWTLEPRLFYLWAKHENQDDLPVFDTSLPDFRFAELFRTNRFIGPDRQTDANQLTLAISSRLLDDSDGGEKLRLSIGQTLYFDDRLVGLPGSNTETHNASDFVGEIAGTLYDRHRFRISGLWDTDQNQANKGVISYAYHRDKLHNLNLAYRYQRNLFEQADISLRWKLSQRWNGVARWTYSLRDEQTVESIAGLEYDSCCWSIQLAARNYLDSNGLGMEESFYIQLNFKGLGGLGTSFDNLLNNRTLGYSTRSTVQ